MCKPLGGGLDQRRLKRYPHGSGAKGAMGKPSREKKEEPESRNSRGFSAKRSPAPKSLSRGFPGRRRSPRPGKGNPAPGQGGSLLSQRDPGAKFSLKRGEKGQLGAGGGGVLRTSK